jgi:hypothetical protein
MKRSPTSMLATIALATGLAVAFAQPARAAGDSAAGKRDWTAEHTPPDADQPRSCATCHTANLAQTGRHFKTGMPIDPMAVSVNSERLTDSTRLEKWFGRSCRWTLGRDCTEQEKENYLAYIKSE